jgi:hypothetical protein
MAIRFLAGLRSISSATSPPPCPWPGGRFWSFQAGAHEVWLSHEGLDDQVFVWDSLALLIRGRLRLAGCRGPVDRERVAVELRWRYLEEGTLDVTGLEGCGSVLLLDGQVPQLALARLHSSIYPIYAWQEHGNLIAAGRLPDLATAVGRPVRLHRAAALTYLETGTRPDRQTLFADFHDLLPGDLLAADGHRVLRFALAPAPQTMPNLNQALPEVARDAVPAGKRWATLVDGSPTSWRLQALLNQHLAAGQLLPSTFSPGWAGPAGEQAADRAMQASLLLGTDHHLIPLEQAPAEWLREHLLATGEPPAPGLDLALGRLARALHERHVGVALMNRGAQTTGTEAAVLCAASQAALRCNEFDVDLVCPLLDSRLSGPWLEVRAALTAALEAMLPAELARQKDETPGQGIRPSPPVDKPRTLDLVSDETLRGWLERPTERLHRLGCLDLWQRLFADASSTIQRPVDFPTRTMERTLRRGS